MVLVRAVVVSCVACGSEFMHPMMCPPRREFRLLLEC